MDKQLRIIYIGTPEFAVPGLELLVKEGYNIVAVMTAPDKPAGRGLKMNCSAVKECALKHALPILQPTNMKSPEFLEELRSYKADLQIVVAFRMMPEAVWAMPRFGTFNLHASLLPDYRGAAPINWAIINGEKVTGNTTFFLKQEIDTGDLAFQEEEPIFDTDTVGVLYERLMNNGAKLILKTVQALDKGDLNLTPQDESRIKHKAPKIFVPDCRINFAQSTQKVYDFVRGLSPYPAAWTEINGHSTKVFWAERDMQTPADGRKPGDLFTDQKTFLKIKTEDGYLNILDLQKAGKKRLSIEEFLRGERFA